MRALSLAGAAALSALVCLPGGTANADPAPWQCPADNACLYSSVLGAGESKALKNDVADLSSVGFEDRARSVRNAGDVDWCLYRDTDYAGEWTVVPPGTAVNLVGRFDQSLSSLRQEPKGGCPAP
ncbi:peptidase inhibitor family I36 protein [Streptomyces odonnellii]|uniref:peptidase inhibitor family I36 protein n=1 Tax=Streptomyces odonnellii TaxID=1417980 RepID=UPI0012FEC714|nr:peptidase inhibitor family I36 protein [Streptomyces odonnellii]